MIEFYVATTGSTTNPGTKAQPFATLHQAQAAVRTIAYPRPEPVTVWVRGGTYYLTAPLTFGPLDGGTPDAPVTYAAYADEIPVISGGRKLACHWQPYRDGIMMCALPAVKAGELDFTQLFINGKRQIRARYPNADNRDPKQYSGYTLAAGALPDTLVDPLPDPNADMTFSGSAPRGVHFDPATFTQNRWARPDEAIIHIYQAHYWGNLQWQIKQIDWENAVLWFGHGGFQMGAKWFANPCEVNEHSYFYIENVFEELDAPGEWYLDKKLGILYYLPPQTVDLKDAVVEVPILEQAVRMLGTQDLPVRNLTLHGFHMTQTQSTFLAPYTIPSLSDWAIHRGGAFFLEGTRDCAIEECYFDAVGGNALFLNGYNRRSHVTGCKFTESGDSAICLVGSLETTVGTQRNFPYECRVSNNLIYECGVFGKQIAGVYISRAKRITVAHNEIHHMPRAGVCIGDGTWGGHVIEHNFIYETCRETGDHGPFNAWGRDRYWSLVQSHMSYTCSRSLEAGLVKVDAMEPVIMRYNCFKERAGWGLDLDDGASNYEIYNNLCIGVSIKLREGAYRTIYNNIWVNGANSPCFHVGNDDNHDRYFRNITVIRVGDLHPEDDLNFAMGKGYGELYTLIAPPASQPWLAAIDHNCFYSDLGEFVARVTERSASSDGTWQPVGTKYSLAAWQQLGFDQHSIFADPLFVDPANGDYRVQPDSPALQVGFQNFRMDQFGLLPDFPRKWRTASNVAKPTA